MLANHRWALFCGLLLCSACSSDSGGVFPGADAGEIHAAGQITGTVTGSEEREFSLPVLLSCAQWDVGGDGGTAEISGLQFGTGDALAGELISIVLDYDQSGPGTYALVGSGDDHEPGTALYETRYEFGGRSYNQGTGEVTITEWPEAAGEPVAGTYTVSLQASDGAQVTISGAFDGFAHANETHFAACIDLP